MAGTNNEKGKALAAAMTSIERQFGKGAIMRLGDEPVETTIPSISTGSIGLDTALGIGGVPVTDAEKATLNEITNALKAA